VVEAQEEGELEEEACPRRFEGSLYNPVGDESDSLMRI